MSNWSRSTCWWSVSSTQPRTGSANYSTIWIGEEEERERGRGEGEGEEEREKERERTLIVNTSKILRR